MHSRSLTSLENFNRTWKNKSMEEVRDALLELPGLSQKL